MTKFLILIVAVLFSVAGYSQNPVIINQPYDFQKWVKIKDSLRAARITPDSTLQLPTGCGVPSGTASLKGGVRKKSAIYRDSCGKKTYVFEPSDSTWAEVGGGGADSVLFATKYGVDTAKNNIRSSIASKLNISDTSNKWMNDIRRVPGSVTVEKFKNGAWSTAYTDSVGTGGGGSQGITSVLTVGQVDTNKTIQFGYPQAGFFQSQQNSPTDTIWEGAPMVGYPFRGSDTSITNPRVFTFLGMRTHRYDVTQPPNVIMSIARVGDEGIGNAYMRIGGLEWDWYNNYEYHPVEMKRIGDAAAIRMQSVTMNRTTGVSTWTQRASQHIFSDIFDNQMLNLSRTASTLTASGTAQPTLRFLTQSTDATNGGLTMATESGQTVFNFHPSSGTFHVNQWDMSYSTIIGSSRVNNTSDPEIRFQGAGRLANNRIWEWTNGAQGYLMVMNVDSDSLPSLTVGGNNFMANGSVSLMAKSIRNRHQKPFAVGIASNPADTFFHKIPLAFDTLGRGAVNIPDPNNSIKDGLLGLSAYAYDWRVFGKEAIIDNTAGFNRLLTLINTDGSSFSGPELRLFNNVGVGSTNGFSIGIYSNGTAAPYTNAGVLQNKEGGPIVMYSASAEIARFTDAGKFQVGSTTDLGSSKVQVTGTIQMQDGNQAAGKVLTSDANGVGTWQASGISSGTYTPTLTSVTNVTSTTAYQCQYMRVGNVVTVSGKVYIDPVSTGLVEVGVSLPIASSISNDYEGGGTINTAENSNMSGAIGGDPTNDRVQIGIQAPSSAGYNYFFTFTYQVL
jgi:hypothetical protein